MGYTNDISACLACIFRIVNKGLELAPVWRGGMSLLAPRR